MNEQNKDKMTTKFYQSSNVCIILTGASQGFGQSLANIFASHYRNQFSSNRMDDGNLQFLLISRDRTKLEHVSNSLKSIDPDHINVHCIEADLSKSGSISSIEECCKQMKIFERSDSTRKHYILIHNAGSLGETNRWCKAINVEQAKERDDYYRLNLYSVMELTGIFIRQTESMLSTMISRHIINISSLAAIQPFNGLIDYCVGKSAREAYFRQLSHELSQDLPNKSIHILNYAPGPLKTEMFSELQINSLISDQFGAVIPLSPEESGEKLFKILCENKYDNGSHVDYYDV